MAATLRVKRGHVRLVALCLLGVLAVALAGCDAGSEMRDRYVVEKMWWRTLKLENAMRENPDLATDEMQKRVEDGYSAIVEAFPPPEGDVETMSLDVQTTAVITARSRFKLVSLAASRGDLDEAVALCEGIVEGYGHERSLAIEGLTTLARVRQQAGDWDGAVEAYTSLFETWQPASHDNAPPDPRILGAPLAVATGFAAAGEAEMASEWYDSARRYYRGLISEWPGSPTAEAAASRYAESFTLEHRWIEAAQAYADFDETYGTERNRAAVWLALAEIHGRPLGRQDRAREYYEMVLDAYGDEISGAAAAVEISRMDIDRGRHDAAQERLEGVIGRFGDDEPIVATALNLLGVSHELRGQWDKALARFTELWRDHSTTMYGLSAPLHIAGHYREAGEAAAEESALEKAADHYSRIVRDYAGTPAEVVALNHLFEVRVRQERWDEAEAVLAEVESQHPNESWVEAAHERLSSFMEE